MMPRFMVEVRFGNEDPVMTHQRWSTCVNAGEYLYALGPSSASRRSPVVALEGEPRGIVTLVALCIK